MRDDKGTNELDHTIDKFILRSPSKYTMSKLRQKRIKTKMVQNSSLTDDSFQDEYP
jgi:hypothetical protein